MSKDTFTKLNLQLFLKNNKIDIIIYLIFPLSFFVFPLLDYFKINLDNFALNIPHFKIYQIFTSIFLHIKNSVFNYYHLAGNLIFYYILGLICIYLISDFSKKDKVLFYFNLFFILPFINFLIHYIFILFESSSMRFSGFSLILFALISFILLHFIKYFTINNKFFLWIIFFIFTILIYFLKPSLFISNLVNLGHIIGYLFGIYLYIFLIINNKNRNLFK